MLRAAAAGVPRPNYTQVPNVLLDEWLPQIDTLAEMKVALAIVRATMGWHRPTAVLSLSQLQRATGLGRAAVVAGLKAAHERGYVDKIPAGDSYEYGLVVDGEVAPAPPVEVVRASNHLEPLEGFAERTTPSSLSEPPASSLSEPHIKKEGKKPSGGKKADADASVVSIADGRPCPTTVDRKRVAPEECALAWGVMDAFNAAAGTRVTAKGFVEKILRRHREHPELSLEDHVRVVRSVLGGRKWWSGRPDPAIIYGSDAQFERCLSNAPATHPLDPSVQSAGVQTPKPGNQSDNLDAAIRWE